MHVLRENSLLPLYLGFFFCFCVAIFNSYDIVRTMAKDKRALKRRRRWANLLEAEAAAYLSGNTRPDLLGRKFRNHLHFSGALLDLEPVLDELINKYERPELDQLLGIWFEGMIKKFQKKEVVVVRYLAFLIGKYAITQPLAKQFLMELLSGKNVELKEEAFYSICRLRQPASMKRAFRLLNRQEEQLSRKVIADALSPVNLENMGFNIETWKEFEKLKPYIQVGILDSLGSSEEIHLKDKLLEIMKSPLRDKETRLAAIRYFGRAYYPPAHQALLEMASHKEWEYAAVAAKSLSRYPCQETVRQAMKRLNDPNWYIRYNNAMVLGKTASWEQIRQILTGEDPYARDIMQYALEKLGRTENDVA